MPGGLAIHPAGAGDEVLTINGHVADVIHKSAGVAMPLQKIDPGSARSSTDSLTSSPAGSSPWPCGSDRFGERPRLIPK
jgi:hypothetical protein